MTSAQIVRSMEEFKKFQQKKKEIQPDDETTRKLWGEKLEEQESRIQRNADIGIRWVNEGFLPSLKGEPNPLLDPQIKDVKAIQDLPEYFKAEKSRIGPRRRLKPRREYDPARQQRRILLCVLPVPYVLFLYHP